MVVLAQSTKIYKKIRSLKPIFLKSTPHRLRLLMSIHYSLNEPAKRTLSHAGDLGLRNYANKRHVAKKFRVNNVKPVLTGYCLLC